LAGGLCKIYANAGRKQPIQRQPLLVQNKHQANPLLSMNNYIPLLISRNDKISSLHLNFLPYETIGDPKNFKNQLCPLVRPSSVKFCQNLSHESVPLQVVGNEKLGGSGRCHMMDIGLGHW
jgi:hypothetical protein